TGSTFVRGSVADRGSLSVLARSSVYWGEQVDEDAGRSPHRGDRVRDPGGDVDHTTHPHLVVLALDVEAYVSLEYLYDDRGGGPVLGHLRVQDQVHDAYVLAGEQTLGAHPSVLSGVARTQLFDPCADEGGRWGVTRQEVSVVCQVARRAGCG